MAPETQLSSYALEERLVTAVRDLGGDVARGDVAARSGLPLGEVEQGLRDLLSLYKSHLDVDDDGNLRYRFDAAMTRRGSRDAGHWLHKLRAFAWSAFVFSFKAGIMITLIGYTAVFVIILLALAVAALGAMFGSDSDSDGLGELLFLPLRLLAELLEFVFWFNIFSDTGSRRGRGRGRIKRFHERVEKPFYQKIFDFVFGPQPQRDPLAIHRAFAGFILERRGRVTAAEWASRSGQSLEDAERALTAALEPEPRTLYLLAVGVSEYADPDTADLEYAAQDARDISSFFASNPGPFAKVETLLLVDEQVTQRALESARAFTRRARPQDAVVVFLAGHGLHARDDAADYYFLTHDADPAALPETAAPFDLIESLLDASVAARDKLALIDTCQSGEDPSPGRGQAAGERSRGVESSPLSTARDRALSTYGRRLIYRDLRRRTGAIVFSSSLGHELSLESDAWANGAFTEALLEALSSGESGPDGALSISELRDQVIRRVPELTRGRQHPTVDRDNLLRDFTVSTPSASDPN